MSWTARTLQGGRRGQDQPKPFNERAVIAEIAMAGAADRELFQVHGRRLLRQRKTTRRFPGANSIENLNMRYSGIKLPAGMRLFSIQTGTADPIASDTLLRRLAYVKHDHDVEVIFSGFFGSPVGLHLGNVGQGMLLRRLRRML
jgi:hypothetical protein